MHSDYSQQLVQVRLGSHLLHLQMYSQKNLTEKLPVDWPEDLPMTVLE